MKNDIQAHNVCYQIIANLPVFGNSARYLMDFTSMGVSQFGLALGLIRGGMVGIVMFFIVLTLSEGIPLCHEVIHYFFVMEYVEPVKSDIRVMLVRTEPDDKHPPIRHWHDRSDFNLEWLNPGRYLLKEDPKPEEPKTEKEEQ